MQAPLCWTTTLKTPLFSIFYHSLWTGMRILVVISIYIGRWNVNQFQNKDDQALWIFLSFFLFCQNSESIRNQNVHCSLLGVRRMVVILPRQKVQQFYHVIKSTYHSAPQQTNRCFLWWSYFQITIFGLIFWFTKNYRIFFNYFFI